MPHPQATVTFGDVAGIEECRFLLSRGHVPSRGVLLTPNLDAIIPEVADLVITYDGTTLTLTDCNVVDSFTEVGPSGQMLRIVIEDRRWRWRLSEITGRYNVRKGFETIRFVKTPQELMELLLEEAHETTYDVSALPNLARPFVDWVLSRCDYEIAELAGQLNCDVAPSTSTGGINVVKLGSGAALPTGGIETAAVNVTYPNGPERIRHATAPVRWQVVFELEAVGLDNSDNGNKIVPVDELSYTPDGGWGLNFIEFFEEDDIDGLGTYTADGLTRQNSDLANLSVFRWYRIKRIVGGGGPDQLNPPGFGITGAPDLESIDDLLPLLGGLNDTWQDGEDIEQPLSPKLFGIFDDGGNQEFQENAGPPGTPWKFGFDLDREKGIVKLPTWLLGRDEDGVRVPAQLYLLAAAEANWRGLNTKIRYEQHEDRAGVADPILVESEVHEDVIPRYNARYVADGNGFPVLDSLDSNQTDVDDQLSYYLAAHADRLVDQIGATASYAGLKVIDLDGAIEQIEWIVDGQGMTTRIARNTQLAPYLPDWKEQQRQAARDRAGVQIDRIIDAEQFRGDAILVTVPIQ